MGSSSTSGDDENTDMDVDGTSTVSKPDVTPREGQLLQGIASLQMQLDAMSQRQDELMEFIGVLREQQEGPVPGPSDGVRARTVSPRGSVSYGTPGQAPRTEDGGEGGPSASNHGRLPPPEQPPNIPPNNPQPPPPHPDPVVLAGPNAPALQRDSGDGGPVPGHPNLPYQGQDQAPGQPHLHHLDQKGQPFNPPPIPRPILPPGRSVPIFGQLQDQTGQVIGLVHRASLTANGYRSTGPNIHRLPPGYPHPQTYPHVLPQMFPQMQPQVHPQVPPQIPPQVNPQIPPHVHPRMPPQMEMQGPMPMNPGGPPGPPPPYPGPGLAPGEPIPATNQAGPPRVRRRASRVPGIHPVAQPRTTGLSHPNGDAEEGGSRREATGRAPTRANPARKARPTQLSELE